MNGVDVVVVNFHSDDLLDDFIESYYEHRFGECTLTVVNVEASAPPKTFKKGSCLVYSANIGYGKACNEGAHFGPVVNGGHYNDAILLANADTQLSEGFEECYRALMDHDDWAILGPRQVNSQGLLTSGGIFGVPRAPFISQQREFYALDQGQCSDIRDDATSVSGALYFVKRQVWQDLADCPLFQGVQPGALGAFLETPHFYDETFCSYHARAHGHKCVYYGSVCMLHHWAASTPSPTWAAQKMKESLEIYRQACCHHGIACE